MSRVRIWFVLFNERIDRLVFYMRICAGICLLPCVIGIIMTIDAADSGHLRTKALLFPIICSTPSVALFALVPAVRQMHIWALYATLVIALSSIGMLVALSGFCIMIFCVVALTGVVAMVASLVPDLRTWHRQQRLARAHGFEPIMDPALQQAQSILLPRPKLQPRSRPQNP